MEPRPGLPRSYFDIDVGDGSTSRRPSRALLQGTAAHDCTVIAGASNHVMAPPVNHAIEVLDRLGGVRLLADQYLQGRWLPTEQGLANLAGLVTWARRHQWAADLARRVA